MSQTGSTSNGQIHQLLAEYTDAVDALPHDLTRSFGDLRELDAVLRSSMQSITHKIRRLVNLIRDPNVTPSERLLLFLDIAEDAQRLKMGSEDKIRVAGRTCDDLAMHNQHTKQILSMLAALDPTYDSAVHMRQTAYPHVAPSNLVVPSGDATLYGTGRRKRIPTNNGANSLHGLLSGSARNAASSIQGNSARGQRKGRIEDDESTAGMSNVPANKKTPKGKERQPEKDKDRERLQPGKERPKDKKIKTLPRSPSPLDSYHSRPIMDPNQPNLPHQEYANQHGSLKNKPNGPYHPEMSQMYPSNAAYGDEPMDSYGQGLSRGEREHSTMSNHLNGTHHHYPHSHQNTHPQSSANHNLKRHSKPTGTSLLDAVASRTLHNPTPNSTSSSSGGGRTGVGPDQASVMFESDDYESMDVAPGMQRMEFARSRRDDDPDTKAPGANSRNEDPLVHSNGSGPQATGVDNPEVAGNGLGDADDTRYCYCDQVSFGEMIGCDDDDCEKEWFHLSCLGMAAPPKGEWFCNECNTKRSAATSGGGKKSSRSGRGNNGGGSSRGTTNSSMAANGSTVSSRGRTTSAR